MKKSMLSVLLTSAMIFGGAGMVNAAGAPGSGSTTGPNDVEEGGWTTQGKVTVKQYDTGTPEPVDPENPDPVNPGETGDINSLSIDNVPYFNFNKFGNNGNTQGTYDDEIYDTTGNTMNEAGEKIDANGNRLDVNGKSMNKDGFLINEEGKLINEDGTLVADGQPGVPAGAVAKGGEKYIKNVQVTDRRADKDGQSTKVGWRLNLKIGAFKNAEGLSLERTQIKIPLAIADKTQNDLTKAPTVLGTTPGENNTGLVDVTVPKDAEAPADITLANAEIGNGAGTWLFSTTGASMNLPSDVKAGVYTSDFTWEMMNTPL